MPWLANGCTVPGLHGVAVAAPVAHEAPAGQPTQSCSLIIATPIVVSVMFWCRPDGHGSAAEAPAKQYDPEVQAAQAVRPDSA